MVVRVIYKDKDIGTVNETNLDDLIKSGRIVAYCRSNGEWFGVRHNLQGSLRSALTFEGGVSGMFRHDIHTFS
jgi:hypothetical protein